MKNKVFVKVIVPEVDKEFDVYLPVNKKICNIIILLGKAVAELTDDEITFTNKSLLINKLTKERYVSDKLLVNTNIRNGTTLVLIS